MTFVRDLVKEKMIKEMAHDLEVLCLRARGQGMNLAVGPISACGDMTMTNNAHIRKWKFQYKFLPPKAHAPAGWTLYDVIGSSGKTK